MPTKDTRLASLKKQLAKAKENRREAGAVENAVFAFWDLPVGGSAQIRFLPDGDAENPLFFLKRKEVIKLPFNAIKDEPNETGKTILVSVPTMRTFGGKCPILEYASSKFNEHKNNGSEDAQNEGRKYWVKASGLAQCFVRQPGMEEQEIPANPIRKLFLNKGLFQQILDSLEVFDPEEDEMPDDFDRGTDYLIKKTQDGQYNSYKSSAWMRKESPLTDEERAAIEKHGLWNLSDMCYAEPDSVQQAAILEMFEASKAGEPYDPDLWAPFYRPFGIKAPEDAYNPNKDKEESKEKVKTETKAKPEPEPETEAEKEPVSESEQEAPKEDVPDPKKIAKAKAEAEPEAKKHDEDANVASILAEVRGAAKKVKSN